MAKPLDIVVLGLSITSSWGNGHATTYRALLRALAARGHRLLFLERDVPSYAQARDQPTAGYCEIALYGSPEELADKHQARIASADVIIVGSFIPDGQAVIDWVQATARGAVTFYDMDTPVTMARLASDQCSYLAKRQVPRFDMYFSFTGGPLLRRLERRYGAQRARPLYCAVDAAEYSPATVERRWDLAYVGTFSADRQPSLNELLMLPGVHDSSLRLAVAGSLYPPDIRWPENVERIEHLSPTEHRAFYARQRWTLNLTHAEMRAAGYSPSVRLFEAAACGVPVITDEWPGIHEFFEPGREIMVARSCAEMRRLLSLPAEVAAQVGQQARRRALAEHTSTRRAEYLEAQIDFVLSRRARPARPAKAPAPATSQPTLVEPSHAVKANGPLCPPLPQSLTLPQTRPAE